MHRIIFHFFISCILFGSFKIYAGNIQTIEQTFNDSLITTKITAKFTKNTHLNPFKLGVSTHDGVVTLSGFVNDKEGFVEALQLAKNTQGVKELNVDDLSIKEVNTALTDTYITAKVEASVLKAKVMDEESIPLVGIKVTTENGIVTITGEVENQQSIIAIVKESSQIKNVKKIIANLEIKS